MTNPRDPRGLRVRRIRENPVGRADESDESEEESESEGDDTPAPAPVPAEDEDADDMARRVMMRMMENPDAELAPPSPRILERRWAAVRRRG